MLNLDPIDGKFTAFGWNTQVINGNDLREVLKAFERARAAEGSAHLHRRTHTQRPGNPQRSTETGRHQFSRQARASRSISTRPWPRSPPGGE